VSRPALLLAALLLAAPAGAAADDLLGAATEAEGVVEERLRLVLAHRLTGSEDGLQADITGFEIQDEARRQAGLAPTGLTDDLRYLAAGLAATRDARRTALEQVLDADPDPIVRRLAEHRLAADDAATATQLLVDDRHNRRAAVLNDAVRPLGLFSGAALVAALNPFLLAGSAADSLVTTAVNLWNYNRLSTPEREALARYQTLLAREPRTSDAPEITRAIRRIGAKRSAALCEESLSLARKTLEQNDLDHAAFYARTAASLDGCAERAEETDEEVTAARARHLAREEAGRWPVDDPPRPTPGPETLDYEALLVATVLGEPGAMIEAASRFRAHHGESPFTPTASYIVAVARDLAGHREDARTALAELAGDDDSSAGRHAAALLASTDYSALDALSAAERQHARDTARYVLLGGRMDGRTALYSAAHLGTEGVRAAESLGILNVIGVVSRAWQTWRKDPISNQTIIDRGEELLARDPHAAEAPAVHDRLADAYERAGSYGRALMHLQATPDPSPKRLAKLERKLADRLLEDAARDGNPALLEGIVHHFGDTDAAEKARQRLAARPGDGETVLDRDLLRANPSLLAADALDIDPRLLDGERDNGELAEGGITLAAGELRMKLEHPDAPEERVETRPLAPEAYERARGAAREALYARLLTRDSRHPESGRFERYVPFYVQGTLDEGGGVSVSPGVKLRRYRSEDRRLYE